MYSRRTQLYVTKYAPSIKTKTTINLHYSHSIIKRMRTFKCHLLYKDDVLYKIKTNSTSKRKPAWKPFGLCLSLGRSVATRQSTPAPGFSSLSSHPLRLSLVLPLFASKQRSFTRALPGNLIPSGHIILKPFKRMLGIGSSF